MWIGGNSRESRIALGSCAVAEGIRHKQDGQTVVRSRASSSKMETGDLTPACHYDGKWIYVGPCCAALSPIGFACASRAYLNFQSTNPCTKFLEPISQRQNIQSTSSQGSETHVHWADRESLASPEDGNFFSLCTINMASIGSLVFCTDCGNLLPSSKGSQKNILQCECCGAENQGERDQCQTRKKGL